MSSKVVITGMGVVSPAGVGLEALYSTLRNGKSCIRRVNSFETDDLPCKIGAQALDFNVEDFLNARQANCLDRSAQLFVAASILAIDDSALSKGYFDRIRVGVFEGTALGGTQRALQEQEAFLSKGYHRVSPNAVKAAMTGVGGSMVALLFGIQGPVFTLSTGCVSSAYAIATAVDQLHLNKVDVALVGGGEASVNRPIFILFSRAGILSTRNETPESACRPFDATRDGVVLGEGAAVLVLEKLEHAQRRGAKIYGEIDTVALTSDAYNLVALAPDASQQARAMRQTLEMSQESPDRLDYISAHGTSTPPNDRIETLAIKKAFGDHAYRIPISSSKSMLGHTLGACTAIELVKTVLAIQYQFIPPTINLTTPDPDCDLDYVPNQARLGQIEVALVNNSSFGGKNSSIILRRWKG